MWKFSCIALLVLVMLATARARPQSASELEEKALNVMENWRLARLARRYNKVDEWSAKRTESRSEVECGLRPALHHMKEARVVGGWEAPKNGWPWQIILGDGNAYFCGGSIISDHWVVTAAHCVEGKVGQGHLEIMAGAHKTHMGPISASDGASDEAATRQKRDVAQVISHSGYNNVTDDIALLKLSQDLTWTDAVSPVCLPPQDDVVADDTNCWLTGWGLTQEGANGGPSVLQEAVLPIVSATICQEAVQSEMHSGELCAGYAVGGVDQCDGDSGGPLVCPESGQFFLRGIVAWGLGCAHVGEPGVYTRASHYRDWITEKTDGEV